jgi:hypothetical protein
MQANDKVARFAVDYSVLRLAPLGHTKDVSKIVPALPTTLGFTSLNTEHDIKKVKT